VATAVVAAAVALITWATPWFESDHSGIPFMDYFNDFTVNITRLLCGVLSCFRQTACAHL
jgi:hypothetical protein